MRPSRIVILGFLFLLLIGFSFAKAEIVQITYPSKVEPGEDVSLQVLINADITIGDDLSGRITIENLDNRNPDNTYEKKQTDISFSDKGTKTFVVKIKAWGKFSGETIHLKPSVSYSVNNGLEKQIKYDKTVNILVTTDASGAETKVLRMKEEEQPPAPPPVVQPPKDEEPPPPPPVIKEDEPAEEPSVEQIPEEPKEVIQNPENLATNETEANDSDLSSMFSSKKVWAGILGVCCCVSILLVGVVGGYMYYTNQQKKKKAKITKVAEEDEQ